MSANNTDSILKGVSLEMEHVLAVYPEYKVVFPVITHTIIPIFHDIFWSISRHICALKI